MGSDDQPVRPTRVSERVTDATPAWWVDPQAAGAFALAALVAATTLLAVLYVGAEGGAADVPSTFWLALVVPAPLVGGLVGGRFWRHRRDKEPWARRPHSGIVARIQLVAWPLYILLATAAVVVQLPATPSEMLLLMGIYATVGGGAAVLFGGPPALAATWLVARWLDEHDPDLT